jgi:hypothetical protein
MLFVQCKQYDASAFEKASGIPIPAEAEQQESYDDGKFVKTTAFEVDSEVLNQFVQQHNFEKFNTANIPQFWGINNLEQKPDLQDLGSFYYKTGVSGNLSWIYIADLKSARLYTEIKYPGKPAY